MRAAVITLVLVLGALAAPAPAAEAPDDAVYIRLQVADRAELPTLTRVVSISDRRGNDVWAYAKPGQLAKLRELGYSWEELPYPGRAVEKTTGVVRDPETRALTSYPTYAEYVAMMESWAVEYPHLCHLHLIGYSQLGREILVLQITDNPGVEENEPEFYYTSTIHGNEETGTILTLNLIDDLLTTYTDSPSTDHEIQVKHLVDSLEIWINPISNADGFVANSRYYDTGGDPNRDFPDPALGETSDPEVFSASLETLDQMRFADAHSIVMSANYHDGKEVVNYLWDTWSRLHADDAWLQLTSRDYADSCQDDWTGSGSIMTDLDDGITNGYAWYPAPGSRQDYLSYYHGAREATIEVSTSQPAAASDLVHFWAAHRQAMLDYMEFTLEGFRGLVTDASTSDPVAATVKVPGHDVADDLSWVYTDPEVGDYHRMILAGTWDLQFEAWGYVTQLFEDQVLGSSRAAVVLDVALQAEADSVAVSGTVTDSGTGLPVALASVELEGSPLDPKGVDSNGDYVYAAVMPGTYDVTAAAWGYAPTTVSSVTTTAGGGDQDVDIALTPSATARVVQGTVTDQGTALPLEGATAVLLLAPAPTRTSDASGDYAYGPVPAGTWTMACSMDGYHTEIDENVVVGSAPGAVVKNFALRQILYVDVSGAVTNADSGTAIVGAQISFSGETPDSDVTDGSGLYGMTDLLDGTYDVTVSADGFGTLQTTVVLDEATEELDFQLAPITTLIDHDFETSDGSFTPSGSWQWGEDAQTSAASGTKVWGTVLGGDYTNDADWTLDSPGIEIPADVDTAELVFQHWYDFEQIGGTYYDGGQMLISVGGGAFELLENPDPDPDYTDQINGLDSTDGYGGSKTNWSEVRVDLSEHVGSTVVIRWRFGSDYSSTERGWYLDDIQVVTSGGAPAGQIFVDGFESGNTSAWAPDKR